MIKDKRKLTMPIWRLKSKKLKTEPDMTHEIVQSELKNLIYHIRGKAVMLDKDLAALYGVATRVLNQAVKRNYQRFPEDFMFQLTEEEFKNLMSQIVISSSHGGRRNRIHCARA